MLQSNLFKGKSKDLDRFAKNFVFTAHYEHIMLAFAIKMGADLSHFSKLKVYCRDLETTLFDFSEVLQKYSELINEFKTGDQGTYKKPNLVRTVNRKQTKAERMDMKGLNMNLLGSRLMRQSILGNFNMSIINNLGNEAALKKMQTYRDCEENLDLGILKETSNIKMETSELKHLTKGFNLRRLQSKVIETKNNMKATLDKDKGEYLDFIQKGAEQLAEIDKANAFGICKLMKVGK